MNNAVLRHLNAILVHANKLNAFVLGGKKSSEKIHFLWHDIQLETANINSLLSYLYSVLRKLCFHSQHLSCIHIWVVSFIKGLLQLLELVRCEYGSVEIWNMCKLWTLKNVRKANNRQARLAVIYFKQIRCTNAHLHLYGGNAFHYIWSIQGVCMHFILGTLKTMVHFRNRPTVDKLTWPPKAAAKCDYLFSYYLFTIKKNVAYSVAYLRQWLYPRNQCVGL